MEIMQSVGSPHHDMAGRRGESGRTKKAEPKPRLSEFRMEKRLTLGELERTTGLGLAVLLAFDDAAVAGQEATLLGARRAGPARSR